MPIDPSIVLGIRPLNLTQPDPIEQYGRGLALKGLMGQQQLTALQIDKAQREDKMLNDFQAKVAGMGGPDNIPAIADAMIKTGHPQYVQAGVALQQKYQAHQALREMAGLGAPQGAAAAPGTTPPAGVPSSAAPAQAGQTANLNPRVLALLGMDDPGATKAAELLNAAEIERRKVVPGRAGAPMWGQDAQGNPVMIGFNPKLDEGMTLSPQGQVSPVPGYLGTKQGLITGVAPAKGFEASAIAGGQEAGKAPYSLETLNTEGAPTLMTRQQAIEAATGKPMPQPGAQPQMRVPPEMQQSRDQTRYRILQDELKDNPNDEKLKFEIANMEQKTPGLKLQDQGASAQQKSYGTQRGQLEAEKPVATLAMNDASSNLRRMANLATDLSNHPGLPRTTGLMGVLPNTPGSAASDAAAKLETLKSQAAFTVLQAMRAASKSGGALGQVSDREEQMLANNLAALQKAQSPDAIKSSLRTIAEWARGAESRMQNAYDMTYKGASALPPAGGNAVTHPDYPGFSIAKP